MSNLFFKLLPPRGQLVLLMLICFSSYLLFSFLGFELIRLLYGFDGFNNPSALQHFDQPFVIDANKVLLFCWHIGLFVLPALVANRWFSPSRGQGFIYFVEKVNVKKVLLVIAIMICAFPIINFLVALNGQMTFPKSMAGFEKEIKTLEESAQQLTLQFISTQYTSVFLLNLFIMAVVPAVGEEFLFRGMIQKLSARMSKNVHWGIFISAFVFSLMHFQFYGFLPRFLLGVLFGYLVVWLGSIWYAVIAHFINNAVSLTLAHFQNNHLLPSQTDEFGTATEQWPIVMLCSVGISVLIYYCFKISSFEKHKYAYLLIFKKRDFQPALEKDENASENKAS